jgi:UDP-N-acetylglucosamine--N-acetylmuramyl-(pentapeptide) pyrophosphoryl-undecaprenol N-acetylglucosamine transferase
LFPGLAVAEQLVQDGCLVTLLVSPKEVDQQAVKTAAGMEIVTLPAVGLRRGHTLAFLRGFVRSYRAIKTSFKGKLPHAVLAMGGFISAPPVLAARSLGAATFLHESNTIPGRANRWLARAVDQVFVGFPQAAARLRHRNVLVTGTPVRRQFEPRDAYPCRVAVGLDPARPVLLVMGGSQGAAGVNDLVLQALPRLSQSASDLQLLHLAGPNDVGKVETACRTLKLKAVVHSFFNGMESALGAATVAVSRAGASSLAELAAMRVPSVLVPYPEATDHHQLHNARAFEQTGAACLIEQQNCAPETLARLILELVRNAALRERMQAALAQWHAPTAAGQIAGEILRRIETKADAMECGEDVSGQTAPSSGAAGREKLYHA